MGHSVPPRVVTNADLEKLMDTSDEWIRERSGIKERRWVDEKTSASDLGVEAAKQAIKNANVAPEDIDFIIFATLSNDYYFPGGGVLVQTKLGIKGIGSLDIRNQCTGFVYGLSVADQFIKTGMYNKILLIGAEVHSKGMDISTEGRDLAVLFGDGAGAVIIEATDEDRGVLSTHLHSDGRYAELLWMKGPGSYTPRYVTKELLDDGCFVPRMEGREVFKHAVVRFPQVIEEALATNQIPKDDIKIVIPHQANDRITEAVRHRLKLPPEKVYSNIAKYGNTTAASIPIALHEAFLEGIITDGDIVILAAFGSGFTWASAAIRW
jgi:3-oxoacyl-[acyl-carrier-protein] synthase-3